EIASRNPTIFVKLTTDPPRCGSTSRKAITANRHRPMVRSAMTSTTNASPIAAATAILGSIPAAMPSSTATAATASCPARPRRSRRAAISGRRPYVLAARARLRSEGEVLGRRQEQLVGHEPARGAALVGEQQAEVAAVGLGLDKRVLERRHPEEDATGAVCGADLERLADRRAAKVCLDEDHRVAGECE